MMASGSPGLPAILLAPPQPAPAKGENARITTPFSVRTDTRGPPPKFNGVRDNLSANSSKHFAMGAVGISAGWLVVLLSVTIWVLLVRLLVVGAYPFAG